MMPKTVNPGLRNYTFKPGWIPSLCVFALLPLFIALGNWQLRRAEEKIALMEQRRARELEPPLILNGSMEDGGAMRFRAVQVRGRYDGDHQFLLDNQLHGSQVGYRVLTPLRIEGSEAAVLVNRGWIPLGADRSARPDLRLAEIGVRTVAGRVDKFPAVGFRLKGAEIPAPGWPSLVQVPDADQLSRRLGYRVLPYQVLLDPDQPDGYVREWHHASLDPGKNRGYALQWFSFAALLAALYVWYGFKPRSAGRAPT